MIGRNILFAKETSTGADFKFKTEDRTTGTRKLLSFKEMTRFDLD